jgi:putative FmdB family regulatory protein
MPLFDFVCKDCETKYEDLIRGSETSACPACESERVDRLLPVFAVNTGGAPSSLPMPPPGSCGSCGDPRGPGACRS